MAAAKKFMMPCPVLGTTTEINEHNPLKMRVFSILENNSAKSVPKKYITYKPPVVKKGKRWYVEYYYQVPVELRAKYKKTWERFRVFEDINRYKTDEYAGLLRDMVELALQDGYSPFEVELEMITKPEVSGLWTLNVGLDMFLKYCEEKGLRKKTVQSYQTITNWLKEYFYRDNKIFKPVSEISKQDIKDFLNHYRKLGGWGPTTYNNYLSTLTTIFTWFTKEDRIEKSPVTGIEGKKASITRHRIYTDEQVSKIMTMTSKTNPYLQLFLKFIYYTAIRPKSEARLLQVKHLIFDRSLIHIPGHIAKNTQGDYVPMADELRALLSHLQPLSPNTYIWGTHSPGPAPASQNHFANMFKPYKEKLGLGADYTIYGLKHTRAIDLVKAGANPYDIMRFMRHKSLEHTMKYLREIGLTDYSEVLRLGKVI